MQQSQSGYNYNPYKIMGFQNKETNEYAINMLKGQAQTSQPAPVNSVENFMSHMAQTQRSTQQQQPIHMIPPMTNYIVNVNANIPSGQMAPPIQTPYSWNFKTGDRCLAKYWEDENVS